MKLVRECPICNSANLKKLKSYTFRATKKDLKGPTRLGMLFKEFIKNSDKAEFIISACQICEYIFINPYYSEEDLNIIRITQKDSKTKEKDKIRIPITSGKLIRGKQIKRLIKKYYRSSSHVKSQILDFGGCRGSVLYLLREDFECYVLDVRKHPLPKEVNYLAHSLNDIKKNEKFNIILLLHTLEHIHNPKVLIKNIAHYLAENGIIIIKVPLGCLREWKSLYTPYTHINFFSELSLFNCVKLAGLNVVDVRTTLIPRGPIKGWELTLVATNRQNGPFKQPKDVLSIRQQKLRLIYYLPLLFWKIGNLKTYIIPVLKKKFLL